MDYNVDFVPGTSDRVVFIYPAGTEEPEKDGKPLQTVFVPDQVTTTDALWEHLLTIYSDRVDSYYKKDSGLWPTVRWKKKNRGEEASTLLSNPLPAKFKLAVRESGIVHVPASAFSSTVRELLFKARAKARSLMNEYSGEKTLTLQSLSNPTQFRSIKLLDDDTSFTHMGREHTKSVIEFFESLEQKRHAINVVTGTKKSGLTCSCRAAALYRFLQPTGRFMYVNWHDFLLRPGYTLLSSFSLAYHDSEHLEIRIDKLVSPEDTDRLIKVLSRVVKKDDQTLYILIESCQDTTEHPNQRLLIQLMTTFAIVVLSGRPVLAELENDNAYEAFKSMSITGGFTDLELENYLAHHGSQVKISNFTTGFVPGFVDQCIEGKDFDDSKYLVQLKEFIKLLPEEDWSRFSEVLAGGYVPRRFLGESTGLFYRNDAQLAVCVTLRLWKYASVQLAERYCKKDKANIESLIGNWVTPIIHDSGSGFQVGLNSEAASILVCRYKQPSIIYGNGHSVKIVPQSVVTFPGTFSMELAANRLVPTLYVPELPTERGLDSYYVDDGHVVCVQFATGKRAVEDHPHTKERALELFLADEKERTHILAWIVYTIQSWTRPRKVQEAGSEYHESFMKFGDLDPCLSCIDDKLAVTRRNCYGGKACPPCSRCGSNKSITLWEQCQKCSKYFHSGCVAVEPCAGCIAQEERKAELKREKMEKDRLAKEMRQAEMKRVQANMRKRRRTGPGGRSS